MAEMEGSTYGTLWDLRMISTGTIVCGYASTFDLWAHTATNSDNSEQQFVLKIAHAHLDLTQTIRNQHPANMGAVIAQVRLIQYICDY